MFNLLPEAEKKRIASEYSRRKFIVILAGLLFTSAVGTLFLVPSFVISHYKQREVSRIVASLKENPTIKNQANLNAEVGLVNKKLAALSDAPSQRVTGLAAAVSHYKSASIRVTSIQVRRNEQKKMVLSLRGIAANRESLLAYANRFKDDPAYEKVDLPISNFAQETDIEFAMTVTSK